MKDKVIGLFQKDRTLAELRERLQATPLDGNALSVGVDPRALPYMGHRVVGWVDGPPSSNVVAVISGADPAGALWRRFALSRKGPWTFEVDAFPTPFSDPQAPLSPGIPPHGRAAH